MMTKVTPSQTVGPYFKYGLTPGGVYAWNDAFSNDLLTPDVSGERIRIVGRVFDGDGKAVPDSMLEIWQADAQGRFADPQDTRGLTNAAFKGFGRCGTDANGDFSFHTVKPGVVPGPKGRPQAPHIVMAVFARGMTNAAFKGFGRCGTDANGDFSFHTVKPGVVPGPKGRPQAPHIVMAVFARGMTQQTMTRIYFDGDAANAADPILALVPEDRRNTLIAAREPGADAVYRFDVRLQGDRETVFFDL